MKVLKKCKEKIKKGERKNEGEERLRVIYEKGLRENKERSYL